MTFIVTPFITRPAAKTFSKTFSPFTSEIPLKELNSDPNYSQNPKIRGKTVEEILKNYTKTLNQNSKNNRQKLK